MNWYAVKAIYRFEMARTFRTLVQSIGAPVLTTSLYFVVFGSAIGSRMSQIGGVHMLRHAVNLGKGRALKTGIKAVTSQRLRRRALSAHYRAQRTSPRPADDALALELRRRFKGEVEALSEYLDRDLVGQWGYADLE